MDLTGKILIAMPGMGDPRFERSVVFLCAHSPEGAMGIIVNKPAPDLQFSDLLDQLGIPRGPAARDIRVQVGGPVEHGRGFVLHSGEYRARGATMQAGASYGMTATRDVLEDLANGAGPEQAFLALGYAGWGPGQLEAEILHNGWLTGEPTGELLFSSHQATKWESAIRALGVDPKTLSSAAGHA